MAQETESRVAAGERDVGSDTGTCVVLLPLADRAEELFRAAIRPAVAQAGLRPLRPNDLPFSDIIASSLRRAIDAATVVIADVSDRDSNILYELGMAHALDKATIIISRDLSEVPFDLRHIQILYYSEDPGELERLRVQLTHALAREIEDTNLAGPGTPVTESSEEDGLTLAKIRAAEEARESGRYTDAIDILKEVTSGREPMTRSPHLARALNMLGVLYQNLGDYAQAQESLQRSIALYSAEGNARDEAAAYANLANVLTSQGDVTRATDFYLRALELSERLGDMRLQGSLLANLGFQEVRYGRP